MLCGLDLGSRSVKLVVMDRDKIRLSKIFETAEFYREYGRHTGGKFYIDFSALGLQEVTSVTATGYGRNTLDIAGAKIIPELKAHVIGAVWQTGLADFTLLDLGGQDSKVIKVRKGRMVDFATNDKCAASTGRYLENMAGVLKIPLEELMKYKKNPIEINSTCAIFGESELIGRIAEGYLVPELAAGVNYSIFRRIKPMLATLKSDCVVFTGGVALGAALKRILETELDAKVIVPGLPQFNGAIGCAVFEKESDCHAVRH